MDAGVVHSNRKDWRRCRCGRGGKTELGFAEAKYEISMRSSHFLPISALPHCRQTIWGGCSLLLHNLLSYRLSLVSIIHNDNKRLLIISVHQVNARRVTPSYTRIHDAQYLFIVT